ncbi:MAG: 3-dehydroquinate synthase [Calditrichia bacterium]|nr:3-dehydroquinate synthase [Calditrichia bacterium]
MPLLQLNLKNPRDHVPIHIAPNIWRSLLEMIQQNFQGKPLYFFTDSHIVTLYEEEVRKHMSSLPDFRELYSFPAGENSKSRQQKDNLEDLLLRNNAGRNSLILAMGGGVTGDLIGHVAANLYRGVSIIHLPTSLIAQVDSSIGGKVGINHPNGKNLLGSFFQPEAVFMGISFLKTLTPVEFSNGMAEVIKYAVTLDPQLWDWLEEEAELIAARDLALLEKIVTRCVNLKIDVVQKDEKESHYRSILNFGHTVGHAIEQLSRYKIKHGFAIASGMRIAGLLSHQLLGYSENNMKRLDSILERYGLQQLDISQFDRKELWKVMQSDKKARNGSPRFTLLDSNSQPALFHHVSEKELIHALAAL